MWSYVISWKGLFVSVLVQIRLSKSNYEHNLLMRINTDYNIIISLLETSQREILEGLDLKQLWSGRDTLIQPFLWLEQDLCSLVIFLTVYIFIFVHFFQHRSEDESDQGEEGKRTGKNSGSSQALVMSSPCFLCVNFLFAGHLHSSLRTPSNNVIDALLLLTMSRNIHSTAVTLSFFILFRRLYKQTIISN